MARKIETGYEPRPLQDVIHAALRRFNVLVCHRRFGKTVLTLNEMLDRGLRNPRKNPQYAYFAPYYAQAKRVAWDYLKEYTKNIPGVVVNEAELRVDIPRPSLGDRIRIILMGAENTNAARGMYFDGVILDEYADMDPQIWTTVVRAALSDRLGWAIFIGTPKGQNHFHDVLAAAKKAVEAGDKDWYWAVYKASETKIIPESELLAARATMSPEEYEQEYECSFSAALLGAYYGKEMADAEKEGRIREVPYDPAAPVDTFWDLGIDDTTVIWFMQQVGREYHAIDHIEESGRNLPWYAKELQKKRYIYRENWLPHDGKARELQTGKSRQEALRELGVKTRVLERHAPEDGINQVRLFLPKVWFDAKKCERGINALKNYERKWDPKNKIFQGKPFHNWASHSADAFRIAAMATRDNSVRSNVLSLPRQADLYYDVLG